MSFTWWNFWAARLHSNTRELPECLQGGNTTRAWWFFGKVWKIATLPPAVAQPTTERKYEILSNKTKRSARVESPPCKVCDQFISPPPQRAPCSSPSPTPSLSTSAPGGGSKFHHTNQQIRTSLISSCLYFWSPVPPAAWPAWLPPCVQPGAPPAR